MDDKIKFLVSIDREQFNESKGALGDEAMPHWSDVRYFKRYFLETLSWEHTFDVEHIEKILTTEEWYFLPEEDDDPGYFDDNLDKWIEYWYSKGYRLVKLKEVCEDS